MLCKNFEFNFEKVSQRVQMLSKTLDADYKKHDFSGLRLYCTPASSHLLRQHTFAAYYQNILLGNPRD